MKFLNYDSPFMTFARNLVDYVTLGLLWIFFCIPVFTGGAATTAALLTAELCLRKEEGKMLPTFWKWFKKEFKEATLLWLIHFPVTILLIYNVWMISVAEMGTWLRILILVSSGLVFCWVQLWYGYLSKFEDRIKTVLSNTFRMSLANIGRVFLLGVISALHLFATVALFLVMPPLLILVPGSFLLCYTPIIGKIFAKYIPKPEEEEALAEA